MSNPHVADLRTHLTQAARLLSATSDTARLDAECLLAFVLKKSRTFLFAHPNFQLSDAQTHTFEGLLQKRIAGWPIAYLTGTREFWSLTLQVTPDTLIPRPETEHLVSCALKHLQPLPGAHILELGTGSGAIALSLATERPDCLITAVDISAPALTLARENAQKYHAPRLSFVLADWFSAFSTNARFDLIVANPPYLASDDPHLLKGDLRFEPQTALCAGLTGLEALQFIIEHASDFLRPGGWLCLEHGATQGPDVRRFFQQHHFDFVETEKDLQGLERITSGSKFSQ